MEYNYQENIVRPVSYRYLISVFLKIGSISFGGFMALISVIQKELVEKDKKISDEILLDGVGLASILPGPVAVNTVCYLGYRLKGFWGGIVSMTAVIFPSFVLIIALTFLYYEYGNLDVVNQVLEVVMPAIVAIIFTVGINMHKKHISDPKQYLIAIGALLILQFIGGILASILVILVGAVCGILLYSGGTENIEKKENKDMEAPSGSQLTNLVIIALLFGVLLGSSFLFHPSGSSFMLNTQMAGVFSSMSLTLFGGGYVIIPLIQEAIVEDLGWLNSADFNTAIALSQVTPGPILVSATFIGFKLSGLLGATVATISIFLPSGLLMMFFSHSLQKVRDSHRVKSAFKGLRPAIIGLIYSASITIGLRVVNDWILLGILLILIFLLLKFNISSALAIIGSAMVGLIAVML